MSVIRGMNDFEMQVLIGEYCQKLSILDEIKPTIQPTRPKKR